MKETIKPMISAGRIAERVSELAEQIARDYDGKPIMVIGILKGGFVFTADLARKLSDIANVEGIDFLRASSYGMESVSGGEVRIEMDAGASIRDKHVLMVEDIVDTGHTISFLRDYLLMKKPASVKVCALLDKPDRRTVKDATFEYLGFTIPDEFVVGYGLDYAQRYRNLPYVGILNVEEESHE